ncbi:MAG: putative toxin-antitoxin system toxin component, PIN family [Coriobacteriales bacterium]|jgi:putative PIN family toxin of toxin-antitoxin system|nr:putative toxin-antitoxin system toxin component, PIN family [Coriobacteriales bacterium]
MKVMIDTNVFVSTLMFPDSIPAKAILKVAENHELVLCDYIVEELQRIISAKRPDLLPDLDILLNELSYKLATPSIKATAHSMSDPKDTPILNAAIASDVDCIISGDKHFLQLDRTKPRTISPADFLGLCSPI